MFTLVCADSDHILAHILILCRDLFLVFSRSHMAPPHPRVQASFARCLCCFFRSPLGLNCSAQQYVNRGLEDEPMQTGKFPTLGFKKVKDTARSGYKTRLQQVARRPVGRR